MPRQDIRQYLVWSVIMVSTALLLAALWAIPCLYTLIGFAAWAFVGHLITFDDDLPGGWSNPDGMQPAPWLPLLAKGALLAGLWALAAYFPSLCQL